LTAQAYYFDAALTFGRQTYMGTGRDFVIRHLSFDEVYRSTAHSHVYLGMEALLLLVLTSVYGTFESQRVYMFFFFTGWLFTLSLMFGALWFNPFALEFKFVRQDAAEWWSWILAEKGTVDKSWRQWYKRETQSQYSQANVLARCWRVLRVSRLLPIGALLALHMPNAHGHAVVTVLTFLIASFALIVALQVTYWATACFPTCGAPDAPRTWYCPSHRPITRMLQLGACGAVALAMAVYGAVGMFSLTAFSIIDAFLAFCVFLWWASRVRKARAGGSSDTWAPR
jgi:hypothetical protein